MNFSVFKFVTKKIHSNKKKITSNTNSAKNLKNFNAYFQELILKAEKFNKKVSFKVPIIIN